MSEQLYSLEELLEHKTKYSQQKYKQAVSRLTQKLIKENRLKRRKLGAGAKPLLNSEDEEFVSNAIASKSTCHERRKYATLYLLHRVKCEGLLTLANYSLYKRGKKLIKSASTIYMRGRPKRLNTIEGKKHRGGMLFCTKKPPKTEVDSNETTRHQKALVKLLNVFGQDSTLKSYGMEISMDDKAYIRPGTDVGYRNTRAGVILGLSNEKKQKKLPQHDFPVANVYQTPNSF